MCPGGRSTHHRSHSALAHASALRTAAKSAFLAGSGGQLETRTAVEFTATTSVLGERSRRAQVATPFARSVRSTREDTYVLPWLDTDTGATKATPPRIPRSIIDKT